MLFGRVSNGHTLMREVMANYLRQVGKALVTDEERQKDTLAYDGQTGPPVGEGDWGD